MRTEEALPVVAEEIRTLSDSTKDLLTQNDQKAEAILPKITQSMDSIKDLVESMNTMTQKVSTIAANTGRNFFPDDLCTEYDRRNAR